MSRDRRCNFLIGSFLTKTDVFCVDRGYQGPEVFWTNSSHLYQNLPGGEGVSVGIFDVDDIEGSLMTLPARDDADTTQVTATSDHAHVTGIEFDEVINFACGDVNLDCIIGLDKRVRITDCAAVVEHEVGHLLGALANLLDSAQLVLKRNEEVHKSRLIDRLLCLKANIDYWRCIK